MRNNYLRLIQRKTGQLRTLTTPIPNEEKLQYYHNMHSSQLPNKRTKHMPKSYPIV